MAAAAPELVLDRNALRELAFLSQNADKAEAITQTASEAHPGSPMQVIIKAVSTRVGIEESEAERIIDALQNLDRIRERMHLSPEELSAAVQQRFERAPDRERPEAAQLWSNAIGSINNALTLIGPDHPFRIAAKARRLQYSHQNTLTEVKLITDVRPVFNEAGDKVVRGMIGHTLLLDYYDGSQHRRFELSLDLADIAELRRLCSRSEGKVLALTEALKCTEWPITPTPDEND